jgi:hypothetical protein
LQQGNALFLKMEICSTEQFKKFEKLFLFVPSLFGRLYVSVAGAYGHSSSCLLTNDQRWYLTHSFFVT